MNSSNSITARIATLERRLRVTRNKCADDTTFNIPDPEQDPDKNIVSDLLKKLEGNVEDSLFNGIILGKIMREDLKNTFAADITEIRDAAESLVELLGDFLEAQNADTTFEISTYPHDDIQLNSYGGKVGRTRARISSLEKRLR